MIHTYSTWLLGGLLSSTLHAMTTFAVAYLIDRLLQHRTPQLRSWLWRAFYVKVAVVGVLQLAWTYPTFDRSNAPLAALSSSETYATASDQFAVLTLPTPLIEASTIRLPESLASVSSIHTIDVLDESYAWPVIVAIWCAGVFVCISRLLLQWQKASEIRRRTHRLSGVVCRPYFASLTPLAGHRSALQIRVSTKEDSPYLVGILRPFIVLPSRWMSGAAASHLSEPVRMILAHELAHLRRRDLTWNLFVCAVHVLFYFHPVLWLTRKRYYAAQEAACDELAIRKAKLNPARYAELLIEVSQRGSTAYASPAMVPLIVCKPRKILFERLRAMQTYQLSSAPSWPRSAAIAIGFVLAALPWSVGIERSAMAQSISLEDSSDAPSSKKPKTKMKTSGASASAGAIGVFGGSSSASGNAGGFGFQSTIQANATADSSDDEAKPKKRSKSSSQSPGAMDQSSEFKTKSSSSRSTSMSVSRETNDDGDTIKVNVKEPARQILLIYSSNDGIEVKITPIKKGTAGKEIRVLADDADDLKKKNPKAYAAYRKYMEPQLKGSGTTAVAGNAQVDGDVANAVNDAQAMMRKQLEELRKNEDLDPAARKHIEGLLDNLPKAL